jgi:hypothetical protein
MNENEAEKALLYFDISFSSDLGELCVRARGNRSSPGSALRSDAVLASTTSMSFLGVTAPA